MSHKPRPKAIYQVICKRNVWTFPKFAGFPCQLDPAGDVTLMTGAYTTTPQNIDAQPGISAQEAEARARAHSPETRLADAKGRELLIHAPLHATPEMTHSVISTTSKLVYQFQSGALNESFADILGEGCEAHFNNGTPDWKMGTALRQQGRALDDPGSKISVLGRPFPSKFSQFEVLDAGQDAGGVHINSSITNHAFYLLAKGMNGAIGLDDALNVFYGGRPVQTMTARAFSWATTGNALR